MIVEEAEAEKIEEGMTREAAEGKALQILEIGKEEMINIAAEVIAEKGEDE